MVHHFLLTACRCIPRNEILPFCQDYWFYVSLHLEVCYTTQSRVPTCYLSAGLQTNLLPYFFENISLSVDFSKIFEVISTSSVR